MKDMLLKAASLCREAADKLKDAESPEKNAKEVVADMVNRGFIPPAEQLRYEAVLAQTPEKLASIRDTINAMPPRIDAMGTPSSRPGTGADAFDRFLHAD